MALPSLVARLSEGSPVIAAELRPPRAMLGTRAGMDAWIDTYHAVRRLSRQGHYVFLTDNAVGSLEEDNLRHLSTNVGGDVPRDHVVPFLTTKHPLAYCLTYADRAVHHGFSTLVVLGGDRHLGPPRCVPHAWQLREAIRARQPSLHLGGWANPHADPDRQAEFLASPSNAADFYLTQVVSHHQLPAVERFLDALGRAGVTTPGIFGVFYYRSAKPETLAALAEFLPVPHDGLRTEFGSGASPDDVCGRTLAGLAGLGIRHVYISNLPPGSAHQKLGRFVAPRPATP